MTTKIMDHVEFVIIVIGLILTLSAIVINSVIGIDTNLPGVAFLYNVGCIFYFYLTLAFRNVFRKS